MGPPVQPQAPAYDQPPSAATPQQQFLPKPPVPQPFFNSAGNIASQPPVTQQPFGAQQQAFVPPAGNFSSQPPFTQQPFGTQHQACAPSGLQPPQVLYCGQTDQFARADGTASTIEPQSSPGHFLNRPSSCYVMNMPTASVGLRKSLVKGTGPNSPSRSRVVSDDEFCSTNKDMPRQNSMYSINLANSPYPQHNRSASSVGTCPPSPGQFGQYPQTSYAPAPSQPAYGTGLPSTPGRTRIDNSQIPRPNWHNLPPADFYTRPVNADLLAKQGEKTSSGMLLYVPPPSMSRFTVHDQGSASPKFVRAALNCVPTLKNHLTLTLLPFVMFVTPFAPPGHGEEPVPLIPIQAEEGPVRCSRCQGYVNAFVKWQRNGQSWVCSICGVTNDTPPTYQCALSATGQRQDMSSHPELCRGSVDYVVGPDYCIRPIQEPIFLFAVDATEHSISTGFMQAALDAVLAGLSKLPGGTRTRVGLFTFSHTLHFYRLHKDENSDPEVLVLSDINDPFPPLPHSQWILNLETNHHRLRTLVERIPVLVDALDPPSLNRMNSSHTPKDACALGAAMCAGAYSLESIGGNLIVMSSLPSTCGCGTNKPSRAPDSAYGTDKERFLYTPLTKSKHKDEQLTGKLYADLGSYCSTRQICVDLILSTESELFLDVATLGFVTMRSGGRITLIHDSVNLGNDNQLQQNVLELLRRRCAFEAVLKVRCGTGLEVDHTDGPGTHAQDADSIMANLDPDALTHKTEVEFSGMDWDTTVTVMLRFDGERIKEDGFVVIQAAVLYTDPDTGQRRVRVHTTSFATHCRLNNIFRLADIECILKLLAQESIMNLTSYTQQEAREHLINAVVNILAAYRRSCATNAAPGQLILPESLKLLPYFTMCLLKSVALRSNQNDSARAQGVGPDPSADERAWHHQAIMSMPVSTVIKYLSPRLFSLHDMELTVGQQDPTRPSGCTVMPKQYSASCEHLSPNSAFLLDTGFVSYIYLGRETPDALLYELFGDQLDNRSPNFPTNKLAEESDLVAQITKVLKNLQEGQYVHKPLKVIRSGQLGKDEHRFMSLLIEDKTVHDVSYIDFLCSMHKLITKSLT